MATKQQIANVVEFKGLRTDTPADKCPADYSPDCSDMVFAPGSTDTRNPFTVALTMPANIVWRKEFTCKDGTVQVLALDVNGNLYSVSAAGIAITLDTVLAGSSVSSVTAYGREYMAFFNASGGCDAPRQWDGRKLYRVSQGAPGAAPVVANYAIDSSAIQNLTRTSNSVTATTATPHGLSAGFRLNTSGVPVATVGGSVTAIVIDNDNSPNVATVTTATAHGLLPGNVVSITDVASVVVGGSITKSVTINGTQTVTTSSPHGLKPDAVIVITTGTNPAFQTGVTAVFSPTVFQCPGLADSGTDTTGSVNLLFLQDTQDLTDNTFTVTESPTTTTFQVAITYADGMWNSGTVSFPWNGSFYVASVLSPTTLIYSNPGPDSTSGNVGTIVPNGQIAPGVHGVVCHFLTETGALTGTSPKAILVAAGGQYVQATVPTGPANTVQRVLSFTGANGSAYAWLPVPPRDPSNYFPVGTSTVINDNTTATVVLDFSDTALLSSAATRIDVPGRNQFQQTALNLPRGVDWYYDRLYWIGEANVATGFINLGMDGGTNAGSTLPLGWTVTGSLVVSQSGIAPILSGTGTVAQSAFQSANGDPLLFPKLNYSMRMWGAGSIVAKFSSASTNFTSTATFAGSYQTAKFDTVMPAVIPSDMILTLTLSGATLRDVQLILADNPNRNPLARASYLRNPEAYDIDTGNTGPNDDNSELRATFVLGDSFHFLTAKRLYYVQQVGSQEPSSWNVDQISDKCGAFNANSVVAGKGWAAWGGPEGAFWYQSGSPEKATKIIAPTWRKVASVTNVYDDSDAERVYFGIVNSAGVQSQLVYDYHELGLGGSGKWCPWARPVAWTGSSAGGTTFVIGSKFYHLDTVPGIADAGLGQVAGYYTFAPFGVTMLQKQYDYLGLRITGAGPLTPFLYSKSLAVAPFPLALGELSALNDVIAEWPTLNLRGRLLFLKLGQAGVRFSLTAITCVFEADPNAPTSGAR